MSTHGRYQHYKDRKQARGRPLGKKSGPRPDGDHAALVQCSTCMETVLATKMYLDDDGTEHRHQPSIGTAYDRERKRHEDGRRHKDYVERMP
jgi:hypothetical protein